MISINKNIQSEILITTMEEIVPENSLFCKIDKYIDFTFIYDEVKELYCENNGRPSIDSVVLFKLVFIQALDGIKSMKRTCEKIKVDAEYRWFLGIPFGEDTPHFSIFSKNYERSFGDSKQNHGYRYTLFKGVEKNQAYTHLICVAQNMKNISIKMASIDAKAYIFTKIIEIFTKLIKISKNHVKENLTFFQMWGLSTI